MIWFSCKQCGKVHGRAESSVGTVIFCDCGQGNTVPWESTAAEPPPEPVEVPATPKLTPVKFDAPPPPTPGPRDERRRRGGARDPNACLNHEERAKFAGCAECGESFCAACLATLQGDVLCGPCKNHRVRALQKSAPFSSMAVLSLALALLAGPLTFCFLPLGRSSTFLGYLALLPQIGALVLGATALRRIESQGRLSGRSLALTGIVTAAVTSVIILLLNWYAPKLWT